ncbi:MAG: hypothetical protein K6V73_04010 [Firmicutes bacterium]|nr:hypothetical protein [Bacillota bacterium]
MHLRRRLVSPLLGAGLLAALAAPVASAPTFRPPADVEAVTVAAPEPGMPWYYPADPAPVLREVHAWLDHARPVPAPRMPLRQPILMDYLGPAQLDFVDGARGVRVVVHPAYFLQSQGQAVRVHLLPNLVAYTEDAGRNRPVTLYLQAPALYRYLTDDRLWQAQMVPEQWTDAQAAAVRAVHASRFGDLVRGFPDVPAPGTLVLRAGGRILRATVSVTAAPGAGFTQVTFAEAWDNGARARIFRFTVGPGETVTRLGPKVRPDRGATRHPHGHVPG